MTHQVDSITAVVEFSSFAESLTSALLTDPGFWRKELTQLALQLLCACQLSVHLKGELMSLLHTLHQIIPAHAEVNAHITMIFSGIFHAFCIGDVVKLYKPYYFYGCIRNSNLSLNLYKSNCFHLQMQIQKCIILKEKWAKLLFFVATVALSVWSQQISSHLYNGFVYTAKQFAFSFPSEAPSVSNRLSDCALSNCRDSRLSKWSWESPCYC